jgi:hypothetical protein
MNRVILTLIFLVLNTGIAFADNFQLTVTSRIGDKSYISYVTYTSVTVFSGSTQVFTGRTDGYGRIIINIARRGSYQLRFTFRGRRFQANIQIDGSRQLKPIKWTIRT